MTYTGFGKFAPQHTPQTEAIPGREAEMAKNNAGGMSFTVDDLTRLHRFLVLGSAGGTFYIGERKLTRENLDVVERLLKAGQGLAVVDKIVEISESGRAPSNDPALFALARCCACDVYPSKPIVNKQGQPMGDRRRILDPYEVAVRSAAYKALPKVARTGTHLLHFAEFVKQFRGRGPMHDRAIEAWYNEKPEEKLAYQLLKYQQRDGWSHRDLLRLARPKAETSTYNTLYHWVTKGWDAVGNEPHPDPALQRIWAFEKAKRTTDAREVADLVRTYQLPREAVPTQHLHALPVWEALLEEMPMEAMLRNLATMTREGVITPMGRHTGEIAARLCDREAIHKAKLHPLKILAAFATYQQGKSARGDSTWTPERAIIDALDEAFYLSFANVVPTGKRILLAIDVSGSMRNKLVNGVPGMYCHVASSALALSTARTEVQYHIIGFDTSAYMLSVSPEQRMDDVFRGVNGIGGGGTDCSIPFLYAHEKHLDVDAIITLSDSETWYGKQQPSQALNQYRQAVGHPVRAINVQMTATRVTNTDPQDLDAMECVGFDTNVPEIINSFIRGEL